MFLGNQSRDFRGNLKVRKFCPTRPARPTRPVPSVPSVPPVLSVPSVRIVRIVPQTMITLQCAADSLASIPGLTLDGIFVFASLATGLKDDIILTQPATHDIREPPLFLPPSVVAFLSAACVLSPASVKICWSALKSSIWAGNFAVYEKMKDLFEIHGHPHGLTQHTFYPPFKMCPNPTCDRTRKGLLLGKAEQHKAVYFGLSGTLPAYSVQLYCE